MSNNKPKPSMHEFAGAADHERWRKGCTHETFSLGFRRPLCEGGTVRFRGECGYCDIEAARIFCLATSNTQPAAEAQEPLWYAVMSKSRPTVNSAVRRYDVAEAKADRLRQEGVNDVELIPLYTTPPTQPAAQIECDAKRWRAFRELHWSESELCAVTHPKDNVKLGSDCPFGVRLEELVDKIIARGGK